MIVAWVIKTFFIKPRKKRFLIDTQISAEYVEKLILGVLE